MKTGLKKYIRSLSANEKLVPRKKKKHSEVKLAVYQNLQSSKNIQSMPHKWIVVIHLFVIICIMYKF